MISNAVPLTVGIDPSCDYLVIICNYSPRIKNQALTRGWAEVWEAGWKSKSPLSLTGWRRGRGE